MANLLQKGQALLARVLSKDASPEGPLSYRRIAGGAPIDLTGKAWVGRTPFSRIPKEGGATLVFGDRDYLVPAAHLPAEPARGDRFSETISGAVVVFEVVEQLGEPCWRWSDPGRTVYRIHTKQQS